MKQVKIGMVGLGFIASGHASCYRNDCRVRIAAAAETDPGKRRSFASRFTVDSYVSDWKDLVKDPSIDVIDITAPNFLHAQIAREALRQGKAVIVEKPLALTLQEAEGVMEELEKRSLTTLYAENRLFAPVFRKAKELLASGSLGQPLILRVNELGSGPTHSGWFWDRSKTGGGALMDLGIHGLCMAEWLLEQPIVAVQALAAAIRWEQAKEQDIEETVTTIARFRTGAIGQFICSWGIQGGLDIRAELFGTSGTLYIDQSKTINGIQVYQSEAAGGAFGGKAPREDTNEPRPHQASQTGWSYPPVDEWTVKGHSGELRHFVDCFLEGRNTESPLQRGYRVLEVVQKIYEAVRSRSEVEVPEASYGKW
jgi:myo-inositol 2-dehydrogenase/D-chiro-inositol 1-dehydrogenase